MAKFAGRKVKLYAGSGVGKTPVLGGTGHNIAINNEPIDVTDKYDDGWRTLLGESATRSVDISIEGFADGDWAFEMGLSLDETVLLAEYTVVVDTLGEFVGNFRLGTVELGTPADGAASFSGTLASSGTVAWTPA
jgi:predicted secreted protein